MNTVTIPGSDGKPLTGGYEIVDGWVVVFCRLGVKSAILRYADCEWLARTLLGEIATKASRPERD